VKYNSPGKGETLRITTPGKETEEVISPEICENREWKKFPNLQ